MKIGKHFLLSVLKNHCFMSIMENNVKKKQQSFFIEDIISRKKFL